MLDYRSTTEWTSSPILHSSQATTPKTQKKARMKMITLLTQARRFVLSVRGFFGSLAYRPATRPRRSMNG